MDIADDISHSTIDLYDMIDNITPMTERQAKKLSMYLAVLDICDRNRYAWRDLPAFADAHQKFAAQVDSIRTLIAKQSRHTNGVADQKRQSREAMCIAAHEVAAAARACALSTRRQDLAGQIDFSLTDFRIGRDVLCIQRCKTVGSVARSLSGVEDYGIHHAKLASLENLIEKFSSLLHEPRRMRSANKEITARLPSEYNAADEILYNHLDNLMPQFRVSNSRFFAGFIESRNMSQPVRESVRISLPDETTLD